MHVKFQPVIVLRKLFREHPGLSADAKLVAACLIQYMDPEGRCWPSRKTILRHCGIPPSSERRLTAAIKGLEKAAFLHVIRRPGMPNVYRIGPPPNSEPALADAAALITQEHRDRPPWGYPLTPAVEYQAPTAPRSAPGAPDPVNSPAQSTTKLSKKSTKTEYAQFPTVGSGRKGQEPGNARAPHVRTGAPSQTPPHPSLAASQRRAGATALTASQRPPGREKRLAHRGRGSEAMGTASEVPLRDHTTGGH